MIVYWLKSPGGDFSGVERSDPFGGGQKARLLPARYRGGDFSGVERSDPFGGAKGVAFAR
jgi:hypothetical protein